MPSRQPDPGDFVEQIRANWAFEHLIAAVLAGAAIGGVLAFVWNLIDAFAAGQALAGALAASLTTGLLIAFLIFLIGFLSGVLVIAPLFRMFERTKRRSMWPYVVASLAIAAVALAFGSGLRGPPGVSLSVAVPVMISSLVIAVLFARRVRPLWRAAEKAEAEEAAQEPKRLN